MSISLLHPWIAGLGLAAVAIPIVIHLFFRQKPKPVLFPALMLLRPRQKETVRRLRIRHWLLLALRCALFALLGLAMARPTIRSSLLSLDQSAPIAAVMIIDDSPSMGLVDQGESRLEVAKRLAVEAAQRMPEGSQIAVLETSSPSVQTFDHVARSVSRIENVAGQSLASQVNDAVAVGLRLLAQAPEERRELYVFSDQCGHAWKLSDRERLAKAMEESADRAAVYLIDVHVDVADRTSIQDWTLSDEVIPESVDLHVDGTILHRGPDADNVIRLIIDDEPRAEKSVRLPAGHAMTVSFDLPGLSAGIHHGELRLAVNDSLSFDDQRFFTVDVRPAVRVLVVAENQRESLYWTKALAPDSTAEGVPRYPVDVIASSSLDSVDLARYSVVCLLNVADPGQRGWLRLNEFVGDGGGLFVSLGARVSLASYNSSAAQQILPVQLEKVADPAETFLVIDRTTHPIVAPFVAWGENDFADRPIIRYWQVAALPAASTTVVPYSNGAPALIERTFPAGKRGRSLLFTSAVHYQSDGENWNELPLGWSFVVLAEEVVRFLSGTGDALLNVATGSTVPIESHQGEIFPIYTVVGPDRTVERVSADPKESSVLFNAVRLPGHYRVEASHQDRRFVSGFSANVPASESESDPVDADALKELFPKTTVRWARDPTDIERIEGSERVGRELFAWIVLLTALVLFAEAFLSNRFYRSARLAPPRGVSGGHIEPVAPTGSGNLGKS